MEIKVDFMTGESVTPEVTPSPPPQLDSYAICVNVYGRNKEWNRTDLTYRFQNFRSNIDQISSAIKAGSAIVAGHLKQMTKEYAEKEIERNFQKAIDKKYNNPQRLIIEPDFCHRLKANFLSAEIFAIDIDNDEYELDANGKKILTENGKTKYKKIRIQQDKYFSIKDALNDKFIIDNCILIYTTPSSTDEWNRFRVIFKLTETISQVKLYESVVAKVIEMYGSDQGCKDAGRIFYGNTNAVIYPNYTSSGKDITEIIQTCKNEENIKKAENKARKRKSLFTHGEIVDDEEINGMLKYVVKKHDIDDYENWSKIIGALRNNFELKDIEHIVQKHMPERTIGEYAEKWKTGYDKIPFSYFVKIAEDCGYKMKAGWTIFCDMLMEGELLVDSSKFSRFIINSGFRKYYENDIEKPIFVRLVGKITYKQSIAKIESFIREYIENNIKNEYVREHVMLQILKEKLISDKHLKQLPDLDIEFQKDDFDNSYIYLSDGFLHIYRDNGKVKILFKDYKKLSGAIWDYNIRKHKGIIEKDEVENRKIINHGTLPSPNRIHLHTDNASELEQFVDHISNMNTVRKDALCTMIGYLSTRYKDESKARAVILCDETVAGVVGGGAGKTLLTRAVGEIINRIEVPGEKLDLRERFALQQLEPSTNLLVLDDVDKKFKFKKVFEFITGGISYEKKGQGRVTLPIDESPKIAITTNFTIEIDGISYQRRMAEYELHPWYSEHYTPANDFGHNFFRDWDAVEWHRFYSFIASCIRKYMQKGLIIPPPKNLEYNRLIQQTDESFIAWVNNYFIDNGQWRTNTVNVAIDKEELHNAFLNVSKDYKRQSNNGTFTPNKFSRWVKKWVEYQNCTVHPYQCRGLNFIKIIPKK